MTARGNTARRVRFGDIRPISPHEGYVMEFITDLIDYGAPEIYVTGIGAIIRISAGVIRSSLYSKQKEGNVVRVHLLRDWTEWMRDQANYRAAEREMQRPWYSSEEMARVGRH